MYVELVNYAIGHRTGGGVAGIHGYRGSGGGNREDSIRCLSGVVRDFATVRTKNDGVRGF